METKEKILKESDILLLKKRVCELEKENTRLKLILRSIHSFIKTDNVV